MGVFVHKANGVHVLRVGGYTHGLQVSRPVIQVKKSVIGSAKQLLNKFHSQSRDTGTGILEWGLLKCSGNWIRIFLKSFLVGGGNSYIGVRRIFYRGAHEEDGSGTRLKHIVPEMAPRAARSTEFRFCGGQCWGAILILTVPAPVNVAGSGSGKKCST